MGVENGLVLLSGSILTWFVRNNVRPQTEIDGVLTDIFDGYVARFLEDHSFSQR